MEKFLATLICAVFLVACDNPSEQEEKQVKEEYLLPGYVGFAECKNTIKKILRAPKAAEFRNLRRNQFGYVCGEVSGVNGFGGYNSFTPFSCSPIGETSFGISCSQRGRDILLDSIKADRPESIKEVAGVGANVNDAGKYGDTPLHIALRENGSYQVVQALLNAGASVMPFDKDGFTPLHLAARYSTDEKIISLLIHHGSNVTETSQHYIRILETVAADTPLHLAARYNSNPKVVETLIALASEVDKLDGPKDTPLLVPVAGRESNVRNISLLLEHGANPNFRSPRSTISPLAKEARFSRNPSIIAALREAGADVNVGNKDGMTALHSASFGPDKPKSGETIRLLLAAGANEKARDKWGRTPLDIARKHGNKSALEALVQ